jgi:CheY-like chemotaxis protein
MKKEGEGRRREEIEKLSFGVVSFTIMNCSQPGRMLSMESLFLFRELPVISLFPADDEPQFPQRSKAKKKRSSEAKRTGNRVLVVGRQRELALYRAEFLRQAGFIVIVAQDVDEAIRIMQRAAFDALVLSYTLPSDDVEYLADAARDYCSDCALIAIAKSGTVDLNVETDAVASAEEGPRGLVSALKRVLA